MAEQKTQYFRSKNNYGSTYLKVDDKISRGYVRGEQFSVSEAMETSFIKFIKGTVMVGDMSDYKEITLSEYTNARLAVIKCFG